MIDNIRPVVDWSGERLVPYTVDRVTFSQHLNRYIFASQYADNKRVLDAACGAGYGSYYLSTKGAGEVYGIDIESSAIEWANTTYSKLSNNLDFSIDDINNLKHKDDDFDVVVSFETLEHLPVLDNYFIEIKRVLKKDGLFIVSVPDYNTNIGAGYPNKFHFNELTFDRFKDYLEQHFECTEYYFQSLEHGSLYSRIRSAVALLLPLRVKAWIKNKLSEKKVKKDDFDGVDINKFIRNNHNLLAKYDIKKMDDKFDSDFYERLVFLAICKQKK
jgi:SAM-dependent methyltransferase